jgi:hypothetical protein
MNKSQGIVVEAIKKLSNEFSSHPQYFFTEEDVRWRLIAELARLFEERGTAEIALQNGTTFIVHGEYPTPFRCKMPERTFQVEPPNSKARRGHFDIVVFHPNAIQQCTFEVVRAQFYKMFLQKLANLPLPFLDSVIELKLFRDFAHRNATESAHRKAEATIQAILKTAAVLSPQAGYYQRPFATRGFVLIFDNSELSATGDISQARHKFLDMLKQVSWTTIPDTLSCIYVTSQKEYHFSGKRTSCHWR